MGIRCMMWQGRRRSPLILEKSQFRFGGHDQCSLAQIIMFSPIYFPRILPWIMGAIPNGMRNISLSTFLRKPRKEIGFDPPIRDPHFLERFNRRRYHATRSRNIERAFPEIRYRDSDQGLINASFVVTV